MDNITKREHKAVLELKKLVENDKIITQKADKGNVIVLVDKNTYLEKMENIVSDDTKFTEVILNKRNKEFDYLLREEENITKFLKGLRDKGIVSEIEFTRLKPCGSQPGYCIDFVKFIRIVTVNHPLPPHTFAY